MANTKTIFFECLVRVEDLPMIEPVKIQDIAHASYCAIVVDNKGYLSQGGPPFVVGAVHSYSMVAWALADYLRSCAVAGTLIMGGYDHEADELHLLSPGESEVRLVDH